MTRWETSPGIEELTLTQRIRKEVIAELSLQEHAKLVTSPGKCRPSGRTAAPGFVSPTSVLLCLWTSAPRLSLSIGLPSCLRLCGSHEADPNPWVRVAL